MYIIMHIATIAAEARQQEGPQGEKEKDMTKKKPKGEKRRAEGEGKGGKKLRQAMEEKPEDDAKVQGRGGKLMSTRINARP